MLRTVQGDERRSTTTASQRTIAVLEAFSRQGSWGVRELAAELQVAPSVIHRLLRELVDYNLLVEDEGIYETCGGLLRLGARLLDGADIVRVARPHLRRARDVSGEAAMLTAYDSARRKITVIDVIQTDKPVQYATSALSEWTDIHIGASGKGILAFLDDEDIDAVLGEPLVGRDGTPIEPDILRAELQVIRCRGWASSEGDRVPGAAGACSAVRNARGYVVGGVVLAWPQRHGGDVRPDLDMLGQLTKETAEGISTELGYMVVTDLTPSDPGGVDRLG